MKQQFIHLLFALPIVLLVGCSNDEIDSGLTMPGSGSNICFEIGFAPQTRVTTDATFTSTWEHGDAVGVFAVPHGDALAASGNYIHNIRLTYKETTLGDPTTGAWGLDDGVEMLWTKSGGLLDFYAYYPYTDNNADPAGLNPTAMDVSVMADQSATTDGKSNYSLSDLLIAKADNSGSGYGKGSTVALSFVHAMAMVQVEFDLTACYVPPGATVQLMGCTTDAQLNLNNAGASSATATTTSTVTSIRMYRVEQPGDNNYQTSFTCRALVPVQDVAATTVLFQTDSEGYLFRSEPLQSGLQLTAGTAEVFGQVVESEDYVPFITDANFKSYCLTEFDKDGDGKLSRKEVLDATMIDMFYSISSLEGINHFRNLTELYCSDNYLTELDVTGLTKLTTLYCNANSLTELDVSALTNLTELRCGTNYLTELDVTGLTKLTTLYCNANYLTELDVSALTNLTSLNCNANSLTELDVSALTNLTELRCGTNYLTKLDVTGLTNLSRLDCQANSLTELNVTGLANLTYLDCQANSLTELDVSALTNLTELRCGTNYLTKLDVTGLANLTYLDCQANSLTELNVTGLANLITLYCYSNSLTKLDVTGLANLTYLECYSNSLTKLDVTGNDALRQLTCGDGTGTTPLTVWVDPNKELATSNTPGKLRVVAFEIKSNGTDYHTISNRDAVPVFGVTVSNKP